MQYITTRNHQDAYTAQRALRESRGPDGGMYLPFHAPSYSAEEWKKLASMPFGQRVAEILEAGGIRVIHDRSLHDYPAYNDAYANARQSISQILAENPSICLVLDLHRDAAEDENGNQKRSAVTLEGESCARLMMVMGSDKGNLSFPHWEQNLALAVKLQACLEQKYEGLCKPIQLVTSRYNQDLSTGALLIEVGTAGNTHREALAAAEHLAEGILALAGGANLS